MRNITQHFLRFPYSRKKCWDVSVLAGLQSGVPSCFSCLIFCSHPLVLPFPVPLLIQVLLGSSGSSLELEERQCKNMNLCCFPKFYWPCLLEVWRLFLVCNLHYRKSEYVGTLGLCVSQPGDNGRAEILQAMASDCISLTSILSGFG